MKKLMVFTVFLGLFFTVLSQFSSANLDMRPVVQQGSTAVVLPSSGLKIAALGSGVAHLGSSGVVSSSPVDLAADVGSSVLPFARMASIPLSNHFWVDYNRTDSYSANGSLSYPYKTIPDAISAIIARGDNGSSNPYEIDVFGPVFIPDNLVFEDTHLTDIYMNCLGAPHSCQVSPASGNALQSTANNGSFHLFVISGFDFNAPVVLSSSGSNFLAAQGGCFDCAFNSTQSVTNAGDWEIHDATYAGDILVDSTVVFMFGSGTSNLTVQNGSSVIMDGNTITGNISVDAGSLIIARGGARLGSDAGSLTNAGTLQLYSSFTRSHISNSGTLNVRGGNYRAKDLTNTGTITREVPLENFGSFSSAVVTCTGSSQNVAHGLGYVPAHVLIAAQDDTAAQVTGYVITEGAHDSTNIVLTCTLGVKVKILAF